MTKVKREEQLRNRCRLAIAGVGLALCMIPAFVAPMEEQVIPYETESESEWDIIRWKEDAEEVSIQPLEEMIVAEPEEPELVSLGEFKLTAYCACEHCSGPWGTQTATGTVTTEGRTVAVDPEVIPYGTVLIINGHEYIAEDCGSSVKGNHIDIYHESHQVAKEHGIKYAEVFTYGE